MKKCIIAILILAICSIDFALAMGFDTTDVPLTIALNYLKWAEEGFGVTNIRTDFDGRVDADGEYTCVDDIIILDDPQQQRIKYIKMNYYNRGQDEGQQILRAMSLFAAIEYGAPGAWTDPVTLQAMSEATDFYKKLEDAIKTKGETITSGKQVPFYVSSRLTYMVTASAKDGVILTVV